MKLINATRIGCIELSRTVNQRACIGLSNSRRQRTHLPLILRKDAVGCTNIEGDLFEVKLREAKNGRRSGWPR